tara:strand:+ start:368 stop:1054 length:687 start_codon:yes stop_codon:yes gene_type:complete
MHLFQNNKKILAFIIIFIFLSTISNKFITNKKNFFTIENINIYGVNTYIKKDLHSDIFYLKGKNFFLINKNKIKDILNQKTYVKEFIINKVYPSTLDIKLKTTKIIAKQFKNNRYYLVGENGKLINYDIFEKRDNLPNLFGNTNEKKVISLNRILKQSKVSVFQFTDIYYFESGRWDLKTNNENIIKLPFNNPDEALDIALKIIDQKNYKKKIIDLRVANQVIISDGS